MMGTWAVHSLLLTSVARWSCISLNWALIDAEASNGREAGSGQEERAERKPVGRDSAIYQRTWCRAVMFARGWPAIATHKKDEETFWAGLT